MTDRIDGDAIRESPQGQSLQQEPNYWQAQRYDHDHVRERREGRPDSTWVR